MKYILNKHKVLLSILMTISITLFVMGITFTNREVRLKGNTIPVESVISLEKDSTEKGSISSIYVINYRHSTVLQNLFVKYDKQAQLDNIYEGYTHLSSDELSLASKIQYQSSLDISLIKGFTLAKEYQDNINIDYSFKSYAITYYYENSPYKVGDEIVGVNNIYAKDDFNSFKEAFNNMKVTDTLNIIRDNKEITITLDENNIYRFSGYILYNINYDIILPKISINYSAVGGPSGGFLQTLSVFNRLTDYDFTKGLNITGTGTMDIYGNVGIIGSVKQKIYTAYYNNMDIFFCPKDNYEEAKEAYDNLPNKERMKLLVVENITDAIKYLYDIKV